MKKVLAVLIVTFMVSQAWGLGIKVGIGGDVCLPQGTWKDSTNTGFGGALYAVLDVQVIKLTADVGYISFGTKTFEDATTGIKTDVKMSAVPVLVGVRYEFGAPVGPKFYAGVKLGYHFFASTVEISGFPAVTDNEDKFTIAPYVGVSLLAFEITGHYMIIEDANYIGLRLAYTIGIGI